MSASSSTTVSKWLQDSQLALSGASIATARLDCLVLLEDATGKDRGWLLANPEFTLDHLTVALLTTKIAQRYKHIPLAYIRGKAEFYGRYFAINEHTLVPRPETETLIELLKTLNLPDGTRLLDIGTGSGCIAVTVALESPKLTVRANDIDRLALQTAKLNADRLHAAVTFYEGSLLAIASECDVIATNLPYVPDDFHINTAATHEPHHALFGGKDGLDLYRELFTQIKSNSWKPHYVLTESLPIQHAELANIAKAAGFTLRQTDDFIQQFQLV